jgi:putative ABC transport system ATP-binding protein
MTTSTTLAAVRAVGVTKRYGSGSAIVVALDNVTAALPAGRFTVVMGPSGSGKSTLLHCLAGLETVDSGRVYLGETDLSALSEGELTRLRRNRVGFVFQSFNLLPALSAGENLLLPLRIAGRRPDRDWTDRVIDAVGLRALLGHRPGELSGGEQQRVAVARALAGQPAVVFADEPTGNLDSHASAALLDLLRRCVDDFGQTVVMVSHDPVAAGYADRVLFIADGRVVEEMVEPTAERVRDRVQERGRGREQRDVLP